MVEKCFIPTSLAEALEIRKETKARPLAGGTDLMVQYKQGQGITPVFPWPVMIISSIGELKGIEKGADGSVLIRALTTPYEIANCQDVPYPVREAASRMGAVALRNSATIGGNIGNASPKGDLPQPLILLDATVVLKSLDGDREVLLDDFIQGSKKTDMRDDEIIYAVRIPKVEYTHVFYRKIGTRRANAISKLSLSCLIRVEDGVVTDFRASSGAAGPKVIRSRETEAILKGRRLEDVKSLIPEVLDGWNRAISPHAMPEYRRNTTRRMLEHFLLESVSASSECIIH